MSDRERVMKELSWLINNFPKQKDPKDAADKMCNAINTYCSDALALLKEQEPRVMTFEEVCNLKYDDVVYYQGINTNSVESAIILHGKKMVPEVNTRVIQFRHAGGTGGWNGINNADLNGYGKKWRCWTSRPTDEQRKAVPWNE